MKYTSHAVFMYVDKDTGLPHFDIHEGGEEAGCATCDAVPADVRGARQREYEAWDARVKAERGTD